jgi:hypothetical protein
MPDRDAKRGTVLDYRFTKEQVVSELSSDVQMIIALLKWAMQQLTDDQRLEVMEPFCKHCGTVQPAGYRCRCWDDE